MPGLSRFTKNRFAKVLLSVVAATGVFHLMTAITLDRKIQYIETTCTSPKISQELEGYTIAFVTDLHSLSIEELDEVVRQINQRKVDLLLLGGDFGSGNIMWSEMESLSHTDTADGIYGVTGNHDKRNSLYSAMEYYGIHPLDNQGIYLRNGLYLAGVQEPWGGTPNIEKAVENAGQDDFILMLSHNPDVSMDYDTSRVDAMLSGHTHGGQITFFGIFAPALVFSKHITSYGQKFMGGWTYGKYGTSVYTSKGTGQFDNIPRIFARPEVTFIQLSSQVDDS